MTTASFAHKGWSYYFSDHLGLYEGRAVLLKPEKLDEDPTILKEIRVSKDLATSPRATAANVQCRVREALLELVAEYEAAHG